MDYEKIRKSSRGNIEIEGISVPSDDVILKVINKYREKLGDKAVNSLLYSINEGTKIYMEEDSAKRK